MARLLQDTTGNSTSPEPPATVDSDFVVILASLLCALICVMGLIAVARCAWLRRLSSSSSTATPLVTARNPAANKGLKKKVLKSLPRETFSDTLSAKFSECAICLTEFSDGDEIRVLPHCGHGFHISCIDTWLGSHSSCPSCRQILVATRCHRCGGLPTQVPSPAADVSSSSPSAGSGAAEVRLKERADERTNRFLP